MSRLRAYLAFCNYYSGYISMYPEYVASMTAILKGNREETKKGSKERFLPYTLAQSKTSPSNLLMKVHHRL